MSGRLMTEKERSLAQKVKDNPRVLSIIEEHREKQTKIACMKELRELLPQIAPEIKEIDQDDTLPSDYLIAGWIISHHQR